jgi:threonine dehydratase
MLPTALDVYEARRRLAAHLQPTPLLLAPWLSSIADGDVYLKLESLNLTHSFKIRGALNAALKLVEATGKPSAFAQSAPADKVGVSPPDQHAPTVVTASAGNHGRALALAAEKLGLTCVVFTPASAPETKKSAIRRHGAVLHADCEDYDVAEAKAREFAQSDGATYISPYNHPDVIAGAGTVGLDLIEAMPSFDVVVIPLGGGGLAGGVGLAVKAAAPRVTIVGVEVEASAPFTLSLEAGRIMAITPRASLADGLTGNLEAGSITFPLVKQVVDYVVTVSEDDLTSAMRGLAAEEHLIVEGAGAAATAAVIAGKTSAPGQRVISLVTGGNVDLPKWLLAVS